MILVPAVELPHVAAGADVPGLRGVPAVRGLGLLVRLLCPAVTALLEAGRGVNEKSKKAEDKSGKTRQVKRGN